MLLISVITPCFNSSATLWRTYESLLTQSYKNFEWILVDDASTDDGKTKSLIEKIQKNAPFKVKAVFSTNNYFGSKSAFLGCQVAEGEFVGILDHDDQLVANALEVVTKYIDLYSGNSSFAGVCGRCVNELGNLIGPKFKSDVFLSNEGDVRFLRGVTEELFQFSKLEVVMPYFEKMKPGYTNGFIWSKVSEKYQYLYVNDVLRIYDTALPTSYSNSKNMLVRYPHAKAEALKEIILSFRPYLKSNLVYSSKIIGSYLRHTINADIGFAKAVTEFDFFLKVWSIFVYPIAILKAKNWL